MSEPAIHIDNDGHVSPCDCPLTDAELGARAARLVAEMLRQAGRYLTGGYGEINDVLIEARKRGWLEPIE